MAANNLSNILREEWIWADVFTGSQAALIEAGYARVEWFPTAPIVIDKRGWTKRLFKYGSPNGAIELSALERWPSRQWQVRIPVDDVERDRRRDLWNAEPSIAYKSPEPLRPALRLVVDNDKN